MTFRGVLARRTTDLTGQNLTSVTALAFEGTVYDTNSAWSAGTPTTLTVPSAWNGQRGIINMFAYFASLSGTNAGTLVQLNQAGSFYQPYSVFEAPINTGGTGQSTTDAWVQGASFAIPLVTGQTWTFASLVTVDTSITIKAGTSMSLYVLDEFSPAYVLAQKASDQSAANYSTPTVVAWDGTNVYDTCSMHSASVNNSKLVIPSSLNGLWVVARCNISLDCPSTVTAGSSLSLAIQKNGSIDPATFTGFCGQSTLTNTLAANGGIGVQSHPFQVATGDTIEALLYCSDTSITVTAARSSFGLTVVGR